MKELILIPMLIYLAIYLIFFIKSFVFKNNKFNVIALGIATIIAVIITIYYIVTWEYLAILWIFNTIMSGHNTYTEYKLNKRKI